MTQALFDKSDEYDVMLNRGLRFSGESKEYFATGRILDLKEQLPSGYIPKTILDFGCGTGESSCLLAEAFPGSIVIGIDTATEAIHFANQNYGSNKISFMHLDHFHENETVELCYVNGVFHHIEPEKRAQALSLIHRALKPGGYFAFFENNPLNLGTHIVMSQIPFDRDAKKITPWQAKKLLSDEGFNVAHSVRSLFYFPKWFSLLRFLEKALAKVPLGAQYYLLVKK